MREPSEPTASDVAPSDAPASGVPASDAPPITSALASVDVDSGSDVEPASRVEATLLPSTRQGFAVVDVETSGLDPLKHRVIEVAVTQLTPGGRIEREWSSLVQVPGGTGPVHIHGLTSDDLRGAPTFAEVASEVAALLDGRILVAHNAAFDWSFLAMEARRAGVALPVDERLCTWHLAKALQLPTSNLRLGTLAEHWNIPAGTAHRAPDDVRVLVEVLSRCLDEAGRTATPLPLEVCRPLPRHWRLHGTYLRERRRVKKRIRRLRRGIKKQLAQRRG